MTTVITLTIIVPDNVVIINGKRHTVDCSSLGGIHAVQWSLASGVIEYAPTTNGLPPSEAITSIAPYQSLIDAWTAVDTATPPTPPVVVPASISRRQLILMLLQLGYITSDEAVAAAQTGALPVLVSGYIASLSTDLQAAAKITWACMSECLRTDQMLSAVASANGLTSAQVDTYFIAASKL